MQRVDQGVCGTALMFSVPKLERVDVGSSMV